MVVLLASFLNFCLGIPFIARMLAPIKDLLTVGSVGVADGGYSVLEAHDKHKGIIFYLVF